MTPDFSDGDGSGFGVEVAEGLVGGFVRVGGLGGSEMGLEREVGGSGDGRVGD